MTDSPLRSPRLAGEAEALLPNDWGALSPLVDTVLDAPVEERAAVLTEVSGGDATRRAALEHLVAECERDMPLLDRPAAEHFYQLIGDDAEVPLPETLGGRYRIDREVGRGGMARVYLAHDLKHARDVAVKVIRPDIAASLGRERFLDEIGIAARLRHPNIVPLYDSGDADGVLYFVMPFEEGPSLRKRLSSGGPLPIAECVGTLRDVARALAYAHEHGVVHRDVKPDNVMMSGGAAVVADFGIARAVSVAQGVAQSVGAPSTVTQPSTAIGTPAYMAPEQAAGDASTDHRADIYSFGCLAYELFTGNPPFHDQPMHLVAAAHASTVPVLVTALRADVPPTVAELVARCLEKDPAARPPSAREVLSSLDGAPTTASAARSPTWVARRSTVRWAGLALAASVIGSGAYLANRAADKPAPLTLAVLPFGNIGADSAMEFVAQGLSDEVAGALARVPGIQIKSRSGARVYRGQLGVDLADAGARLKADYLMTGVVRQEGGRWILSADLARAADATSLWGEAFNVSPDQHAGAAEAIAATLVTALRSRFPKLIGLAPALRPNQQTSNPDAYRLYLRGQERLDRRGQGVEQSAELFRMAIRQDSLFAKAYSGLSMALALFPHHQGVPVKAIHDDVLRAARRALDLDSTLAQPHVALGVAYGFDYQWDSAATEFRTAIRLDDRDVEARHQYARHLRNRGRLTEAMGELRAARALDPASAVVLSNLSYVYYLQHQMDSALVESRRALENDSTNRTTLVLGAFVRLANNLPNEARKLIDRAPATTPFIAYVIAKSGDTATARRLLREQDAETPQPGFAETRRAYTYLGLGDTAQALTALERAMDAKEIWPVVHSFLDPIHDPIRQSPRFKALLRRVGLDP